MKRAFDLITSSVALAVLALPLLIVALLIRLESPGPAIFCQVRVGRHAKPFVCYKLRTMIVGAKEVPTHEALTYQITDLGRLLRRSKIDELPQLWNVLRGEMSIVGPRPCLPTQTELIEHRRRRGVLALQPGITGIAQIAGKDMSDPEGLAELDATYICRAGLRSDLSIIISTFSDRAMQDRSRNRTND